MTTLVQRLERCAAADERMATLTPDECRLWLSLWVAANETVAFHDTHVRRPDDLAMPHKRLRDAVKGLTL